MHIPCEHGKRKSRCKKCGGSAFCEHGKYKSRCMDCGGSEICEHGKRNSCCHKCGGSSFCEHDKRKSHCMYCGGSAFCEHGKQKSYCRDCCGSAFCEHGKRKSHCRDCGGSEICEHGKQKSCCHKCDGSSICEHGKYKTRCKYCGGSALCPNCITWIDSRHGSKKYDGCCATCFKRIFPDDPRSQIIYAHTKEIMVRNMINANFDGFIHDISLYTGNCDCTHRRRIDHRLLIGNTILAIETDEFAHRGYDKKDEEIRYDDVFMIHGGKWIFIRFNPDSNIDKTDIDDKLNKLCETITDTIERIENDENEELLEIIKLYC